jgi:hypothetical protein
MAADIEIAKRGESIFTLSPRRLNGRTSIYIKVHPSIEALIKSWGSGISSNIYDFGGRGWTFAPNLTNSQQEVWDLDDRFLSNQQCEGGYFTLARPGYDLLEEIGQRGDGTVLPRPVVNVSFLRLVGISSGLEFELPGVHSVSYLRSFRDLAGSAVKRLYVDYLLPIDLTLQVNTQETRL